MKEEFENYFLLQVQEHLKSADLLGDAEIILIDNYSACISLSSLVNANVSILFLQINCTFTRPFLIKSQERKKRQDLL